MAHDDRQEVIFEVEVGYAWQNDRHSGESRDIEAIVVQTLTVDLPQELERVFDVKTEIIIKGTRYGSLVVFFAAIVTAYGALSGNKGLLESVELIRDQARDMIDIALRRRDAFNVSVRARYPGIDYFESGAFRRLRRLMHSLKEDLVAALTYNAEFRQPQRDGFFYFLLALSLIELTVIAVLIGG